MSSTRPSEMMSYLIGFILLAALGFCRGAAADEQQAVRALEVQGFENIKVLDHYYFAVPLRGCSESDTAMFKVQAVNPAKKKVITYVCVGWPFKGATVRTQ